MLTDGFHEVPAGRIAMVVTHLEMRAPPRLKPAAGYIGLSLRPVTDPTPQWYRVSDFAYDTKASFLYGLLPFC